MPNRSADRQRLRHFLAETSGTVPAAIPPHPPLLSGGWYQGMRLEEVIGPGRYPLDPVTDKSVGTALAVALIFGPIGLCYVSVTGGLICTVLTAVAVILFGFAALLIAWPITLVCAGIVASGMRREYRRG